MELKTIKLSEKGQISIPKGKEDYLIIEKAAKVMKRLDITEK